MVFLVVDDDAQVRFVIREYLLSFGYRNILEAKNGRAALRYLNDPNQRLNFIISDWQMPKLDGLGLLKAVRGNMNRRHLIFLFITSASSMERMKVRQAVWCHVDGYIVKPFRGATLKEKVEALTEEFNQKVESGWFKAKKRSQLQWWGKVVAALETGGSYGSVVVKEESVRKDGKVFLQSNIGELLKRAKRTKPSEWFDVPIKLFRKALQEEPGSLDYQYFLAQSLFYRGDRKEALGLLEEVLAMEPTHKPARQLRATIEKSKSTSSK